MLRGRAHDVAPFFLAVDLVNLLERFIHIGNGRDQGRVLPDCAADRLPVERVTPAVVVNFGQRVSIRTSKKWTARL